MAYGEGVSAVRVAGGGNTFFTIGSNNNKIMMLTQATDTPGAPLGQGAQAIQGIGDRRPVEIVTPYAQGAGTVQLQVYAVWGKDAWISLFDTSYAMSQSISGNSNVFKTSTWSSGERLGLLDNVKVSSKYTQLPGDIVEMLDFQRSMGSPIRLKKVELGAKGDVARIKSYKGCKITNIGQAETVQNNTMTLTPQVTIQYTYFIITSGTGNGSYSLNVAGPNSYRAKVSGGENYELVD